MQMTTKKALALVSVSVQVSTLYLGYINQARYVTVWGFSSDISCLALRMLSFTHPDTVSSAPWHFFF